MTDSSTITRLPQGLQVSDLVATSALIGLMAGAQAQVSGAVDTVTYVSLPPGSDPSGRRAILLRVGDADTVTTSMSNGGFDPVPVPAQAGDSIEVVILGDDGAPVALRATRVRPRRPPIVVRTNPPQDETDVPVNASIVIVFSEPVQSGTVTPSSVQLLRGSTVVPGTVTLLEGATAAAVFTPSSALTPDARYRLIVTREVRDLSGDALSDGVEATFSTGTRVTGPVVTVSLPFPDSGFAVSVGTRIQFTAAALDAGGNIVAGRPILWASDDPSVATITSTGLVTAIGAGDARISAQIDGQLGSSLIHVSTRVVPIGSVRVTPDSAHVPIGQELHVRVVLRDTTGFRLDDVRLATWTSSDSAVATVTGSTTQGAVATGVTRGVARIVVTVEDHSDSAMVSVAPFGQVIGLVLSPDTTAVVLQTTTQLAALSNDDEGFMNLIDSSQVAWTSSDPTVASVTATGLVRGLQGGSATITGAWSGFQATTSVTVVSLSFATISVGGNHSCGLMPDGRAFCWGDGQYGQLGNGRYEWTELMPVAVAGGHAFTAVNATWNSNCALDDSGAAFCWGRDPFGMDDYCSGLSSGAMCNPTPTAIPGGRRFTVVSAGGTGAVCGLGVDSLAYCWGNNYIGQFGTGDSSSSATPRAVADGRKFAAISVGGGHACALTASGTAYCWGVNHWGQLGTGDTAPGPRPRAVTGGLTFSTISAGGDVTCALTTGGVAYCWGYNWPGLDPFRVEGVTTFVTLDVGESGESCGLTSTGTISCWHWWHPVPDAAGPFSRLSVGASMVCAVTPGGVGYCWGQNGGRFGNGTTADSPAPVKIGGQP